MIRGECVFEACCFDVLIYASNQKYATNMHSIRSIQYYNIYNRLLEKCIKTNKSIGKIWLRPTLYAIRNQLFNVINKRLEKQLWMLF